MNDTQKQTLLKVARDTIEAVVKNKQIETPHSDDPQLNAPCGCFVTLKSGKQLRGCIGRFISDIPLIELIGEMAIASATEDPRFAANRIKANELDKLDIEISVLSPLQKTDNPLNLKLGVHGIYIKRRHTSGCFLPQVATETGWSKEEFLSYCCSHKAGLSPDAWKDAATEVSLFTAEVFGADFARI